VTHEETIASPVLTPEQGPVFPALDALRAVGALAVFTTHAAYWAGAYIGHGVWGSVLARLDVGVAIFFVLSGFLLARPYLARALDRRPAPALGHYYWKRALRILPLYVVTALLALGLITKNNDLGRRDWFVTLVFGNTFVDRQLPDGLTHMWSLAVEVSFYVFLPLLMLVAVGRRGKLHPRRVLALVLVMVAVTVGWELWASPWASGWSTGQPNEWLPAYLCWFGIGILLALVELLHRRGTTSRWVARVVSLAGQPGSCWAMAGGLLLITATPLAGPSMLVAPTPGQLLAKNLAYAAIGGLVVLTGIFPAPGSAFARVLGQRWARHLGFISYGFFCLHLPVLHFVMWVTGWPLFEGRFVAIWAFALVLSLAAAELAYRLIELPATRLRPLGRGDSANSAASTDASTR
jgi:peptidoglycan/LPS O-acetylase OafA/YrhL